MARLKLTDRIVQAIPAPARERTEVFDADPRLPGFGLRVSATGRKIWVLVYRHAGIPRRLTLGSYPILGLAAARDRARQALALITQGRDPQGEKQGAREALTLAALSELYLEYHAKPKKRSWREDERILDKYLPRSWKRLPAASITRGEVRDLLDALAERTPVMANRVLACVRKVYNFGMRRELVEANPCHSLERPGAEHPRERVLAADEIQKMWKAAEEEEPSIAAIFKLHLLTLQRGYEIRTMRWEDLNSGDLLWTIPAERTKNKRTHYLPLSPQAIQVIASVPRLAPDWVFPAARGDGYRQDIKDPLNRVRERSGIDFWPHDLRRTAASRMTALGVPRLVVQRILNHTEAGVTAVYDRHSYLPEMREALTQWATQLDALLHRPIEPVEPALEV